MSPVDIVLLAVGVFFIARGLVKGLTGEIFSLVGTVGGFILAILYHEPFAEILSGEKFGISVLAATIISMLVIFFVIFFGCALLDTVIKKVIKKTNLTFTDKFFGGIVGVIKMYFVALTVLVAGIITEPITGDAWMKNSRVLTATSVTWPFVSPLLENAGLMPDVAALQEKARDYIMQHAEGMLTITEGNVTLEANPETTEATETPETSETTENAD